MYLIGLSGKYPIVKGGMKPIQAISWLLAQVSVDPIQATFIFRSEELAPLPQVPRLKLLIGRPEVVKHALCSGKARRRRR